MIENRYPLENVIAERVNSILKNDLILQVKIEDSEHAQKMLGNIVLIYNEERPHLSTALLTPNQAHA